MAKVGDGRRVAGERWGNGKEGKKGKHVVGGNGGGRLGERCTFAKYSHKFRISLHVICIYVCFGAMICWCFVCMFECLCVRVCVCM